MSEPTDAREPDPLDDPLLLATRRFEEYVDVWERAVNRLVAGDYHAEDLVDDSFSLWGKWVRDASAASALAWRAVGVAPRPDGQGDER